MSFKAFVWAWDQPLEKDEYLVVLLALADIANESGSLYASCAYIAKHARRNERTVRRALAAMNGTTVTIIERPGRTDLIRLNIPDTFMVSFHREEEHEQGKRGRPRKTLAKVSENPGHGDGKPPTMVSDEPVIEPGTLTSEAKASVGRADEVRSAFDAYNAMADRLGAGWARTLNSDRRRRLKARLQDCGGLDGWAAALERAEKSAFLTGQTHHHFSITLDFILQPSSFTKLTEGQYEDKHDGRGSPATRYPTDADRAAERTATRIDPMLQGAQQALARPRRWSIGG